MNRTLLIAAALLLAAGCTKFKQDLGDSLVIGLAAGGFLPTEAVQVRSFNKNAAAAKTWIGSTSTSLIASWGLPDAVQDNPDRSRCLIYIRDNRRTSPSLSIAQTHINIADPYYGPITGSATTFYDGPLETHGTVSRFVFLVQPDGTISDAGSRLARN